MTVLLWVYYGCVGLNAGAFLISELGHDDPPPPKATWADYCRLGCLILMGPGLWLLIAAMLLTRRHMNRAEDA